MTGLFTRILNMSAAASVVILVVLLARLILRRAPKKWSYLLWLAAAFRLCCPVSMGSAISLFNLAPKKAASGMLSPAALATSLPTAAPHTALPTAAQPTAHAISTAHAVKTALATANAASPTAVPNAAALSTVPAASAAATSAPSAAAVTASAGDILLKIGCALWLAGAAAMLILGVFRYVSARRRTRGAAPMEGRRGVYISQASGTPFILGLFRPRIFVPQGLTEAALEAVLAHERCHIKRSDNIIKAFAYIVLSVHWFNPLCWLAFNLMSRDMEMSCDERVIEKGFDPADYGSTILAFASNRRFPAPEPTAFGESDAKRRITNVLSYKKPKRIVSVLIALLCCAVLAACSLNARGDKQSSASPAPSASAAPTETAAPTESSTEPAPTVYRAPELIKTVERPRVQFDSAGQYIADSADELDTWGTAYYLPDYGDMWVRGCNRYYQTGRNKQSEFEEQTYVLGRMVSFRVRNGRVFALNESGELWAWGVNASGNLEGIGSGTSYYLVGDVKEYDVNYALTKNGKLYCTAFLDQETLLNGGNREKVMDGIASYVGKTYQWCYAIDKNGTMYYLQREDYSEGVVWTSQVVCENADSVEMSQYCDSPYVIKKDGTLSFYGKTWNIVNNTYDFEEKVIAENVCYVLPFYDEAYFIKNDGSLWGYAGEEGGWFPSADRKNAVKLLDDAKYVIADYGMGEHLGVAYAFAIRNDDTLWAWGMNAFGELGVPMDTDTSTPVQVAEDVAMVSSDGFSTYIVKTDGSLWAAGYNGAAGTALEEHGGIGISPEDARLGDGTRVTKYEFVKIMDDVASVSQDMIWINLRNEYGYGQNTVSRTIALKTDGTVWAWGYNEDGCIVNGGDKYLLSPVEIMRPDAPLFPETMEETSMSISQHDSYYRTAKAILAGKPAGDSSFYPYGQYVWFRLEDDGLKAYATKTVHQTLTPSFEFNEEIEYTDLLAVYPREVGELANRKLCEYANEYIYYNTDEDSMLIYEGMIGDNWFALVTLDDSLQDLQVHCLFYNDGGEWKEIKPCKGAVRDGTDYELQLTIFGAYAADENTAYVVYYSKHLWDEELGFSRPYVYRTEDGGETWNRLDISLPESYLEEYPYCLPLSPVFDGDHGVMILSELYGGHMAWLESFDNGLTWEYRINE